MPPSSQLDPLSSAKILMEHTTYVRFPVKSLLLPNDFRRKADTMESDEVLVCATEFLKGTCSIIYIKYICYINKFINTNTRLLPYFDYVVIIDCLCHLYYNPNSCTEEHWEYLNKFKSQRDTCGCWPKRKSRLLTAKQNSKLDLLIVYTLFFVINSTVMINSPSTVVI